MAKNESFSFSLSPNPLLVPTPLAVAIGLNEALFAQQVHYWVEVNKAKKQNLHDGFYWTYNTIEQWNAQFPFWSIGTVRRTIKNLEELGVLITGEFNKLRIDRTKWYRLNYPKVRDYIAEASAQNVQMAYVQNVQTNTRDYLTKDYEKNNNTSISSKSTMLFLKECDLNLKDEIEDILIYFYETYKKRTGKDHPKLKQNQLERIYSFLAEMLPSHGYDESMIDEFFDEVKKTDYNVNHFATEGMYQILIRRVT